MRPLVRFPQLQSRLRRRALVSAAEALLEGSYLEYLLERRRPVPAWATLNAAAHGSPEWVRIVACRGGDAPLGCVDPLAAASTIAADLLGVVGNDDLRLAATQASVLVPLELHLMGPMGSDPGPASLAGVVSSTRSLLLSGRRL